MEAVVHSMETPLAGIGHQEPAAPLMAIAVILQHTVGLDARADPAALLEAPLPQLLLLHPAEA